MTDNSELEKQVTPEQLARALPGGLAMYHTSGEWQYGKHHELLEDKFIQAENKPVKYLVSMPPRHGKTEFLLYFIAWYMMRNSNERIMIISHSEDFATSQISRRIRNIVREVGPKLFNVDLDPEATSVKEWHLTNGSNAFCAGASTSVTGRGSTMMVIEDLLRGKEDALNTKYLEELRDKIGSDIYTRLQKNGSIIVNMTRWSPYDPIAYFKELTERGAENFEEIILPALAEENDPLGREEGDALWPEFFDRDDLLQKKNVLGDFWFNAEYQQRPVATGGNLVEVEKIKRFSDLPVRKPDFRFVSWDTAYKEKEHNDPSVAQIWEVYDNKVYLVEQIRERLGFTKLQEYARTIHENWRPNIHVVEDRGSGTSLIQWMKEQKIPVHEEPATTSKIIRMDAETPQINTGLVYIPADEEEYPFVRGLVDELMQFPYGQHDDQADAMSQALKFIREKNMRAPLQIF